MSTPLSRLLAAAALTAAFSAQAAPLIANPFVTVENRGPNAFLASGVKLLIGAQSVSGAVGPLAVVANSTSSSAYDKTLAPLGGPALPNLYASVTDYHGETGQWQITATDSTGSSTSLTHVLDDIRVLPLLTGLAVSGNLLAPTLSWNRADPSLYPSLCGPCPLGFDFFTYSIEVRDTAGRQLYISPSINNLSGVPTSLAVPQGVLRSGEDYLLDVRFTMSELESINPNGSFNSFAESRSITFLSYTTRAVPEPASLALAVAAFGALVWRSRRAARG